jgi:excisionase family DNA binding protein
MEQLTTDFLSLREAATELDESPDSMRRRLKRRELPFYRIGNGPAARIRISRHDLKKYLNAHYIAAADKSAKTSTRKIPGFSAPGTSQTSYLI